MSEAGALPSVEQVRRSAAVAGRRNMLLLTHLRWVAGLGQLGAILFARFAMGVDLPIRPMMAVIFALSLLNLATLVVLRRGRPIANWELFAALLLDFGALSAQLYMSGGATNPFAPIGLLQVVLGAVLLEAWSSWALVMVHSLAFGLLTLFHRPLVLPSGYAISLSSLQIVAGWINFVLVAVLLVFFVTRIGRNLRLRDASLAEMRQRAAEEDHVVRMGLLASGAAHELGTPLSSLSVILGDWRHQPRLARDPALAEEIGEMQAAVARCKDIVGGILYASGEARSEDLGRDTLRHFVVALAGQWSALRPGVLRLDDRLGTDPLIAVDRTLAQIVTNVLDNAVEAGAAHVTLRAETIDGHLVLTVEDDGSGFPAGMLETIGKPYRSTKERRGAGLGLFLAVNVMRKLGGSVDVRNGAVAGAVVTLSLPLRAIMLEQAGG